MPPEVLKLRPTAVYCRLLAVRTALGFWRDFIPDFYSHCVARNWKPIKCMLKRLFRRCKQHKVVRKKLTCNGWSCNFQQWHPRWLGCDIFILFCRLWRGVVTAYTLVWVQHPRWLVVILTPMQSCKRASSWNPKPSRARFKPESQIYRGIRATAGYWWRSKRMTKIHN